MQKGNRKMQVFENQALAFCWVPGAGIEPARIAPLVFETSASTDSAIRAGVLFCSLKSGRKEALEGFSFSLRIAKVSDFSEFAKLIAPLICEEIHYICRM